MENAGNNAILVPVSLGARGKGILTERPVTEYRRRAREREWRE
jgi:hypothetical protein